MNSAPLDSPRWSAGRWIFVIAAILMAQTALVFLFSDRNPISPRRPTRPAPFLALATRSSDLRALENPTLFVLPNQRGFSGLAWLNVPFVHYQASDWTEPPRWLVLRTNELGAAFRQLVQTTGRSSQHIAQKIEPEIILPKFPSPNSGMISRSTLRLKGDLANRALVTNLELPLWTRSDSLTNSVVQLLVNADGFPLTTTLLASSGLKEADDKALALSKAARFEPIRPSERKSKDELDQLVSGNLIFEWQTTPLLTTNTTSQIP